MRVEKAPVYPYVEGRQVTALWNGTKGHITVTRGTPESSPVRRGVITQGSSLLREEHQQFIK